MLKSGWGEVVVWTDKHQVYLEASGKLKSKDAITTSIAAACNAGKEGLMVTYVKEEAVIFDSSDNLVK